MSPYTDDFTEQPCPCHGKTEAQLAMPYALFSFGLAAAAVLALIIVAVAA